MTVETATYISDLNASYPAAGDAKSEGDDHMRLIKSTVKATFPNISGAVTPTHTELNYVDGVTSAIQTQIDAKAPTASPTFTGNVVLPSTTSIGNVDATELGYLNGVTSAIQTQINAISPGWKYLSTVTASASATVDLETTFDATYDAYAIVAVGVVPASNNVSLRMTMKVGGAYASANYRYHVANPSDGSTSYAAFSSTSDSSVQMTTANVGTGAGSHVNFILYVTNPAGTSLPKISHFAGSIFNTLGSVVAFTGAGGNTATTALTGIRFAFSSGNITSGKFRLYGIKNS